MTPTGFSIGVDRFREFDAASPKAAIAAVTQRGWRPAGAAPASTCGFGGTVTIFAGAAIRSASSH
jgi:hypothetical protein